MANTDTSQGATRPVLTVQEVAHLLGISRGSAYRAAREGDLPTIRIGKRLLVVRAPLERMLDRGDTERRVNGT